MTAVTEGQDLMESVMDDATDASQARSALFVPDLIRARGGTGQPGGRGQRPAPRARRVGGLHAGRRRAGRDA